jgi:hypothetical protein
MCTVIDDDDRSGLWLACGRRGCVAPATPKAGLQILVAPQQFELVGSSMLEKGLQAIVIKPSAPFPFLKLPTHLRTRILKLNLTPTTNKGRLEFINESKSEFVKAKDYLKDFKHTFPRHPCNQTVIYSKPRSDNTSLLALQ